MNVSEELADAMPRIEPENVRVLNAAALNAFGLTQQDPVASEANEVKIAQRLGLTLRRIHAKESACLDDLRQFGDRLLSTLVGNR